MLLDQPTMKCLIVSFAVAVSCLTVSATSKSEQKCEEYSSLSLTGSATNEFPYVGRIALEKNNPSVVCLATLISEKYAIMPAHCLLKKDEMKFVRFGSTNINLTEEGENDQKIKILNFIKHPSYDQKNNKNNDIALLELETVSFNKNIKPICLNSNKQFSEKNLVLSATNKSKTILHKIALTNVLFDGCKELYKAKIELDAQTQICFEEAERSIFGGPVADVEAKNLYAIASFGSLSGGPQVYTNVAAYVDWIESIAWPN